MPILLEPVIFKVDFVSALGIVLERVWLEWEHKRMNSVTPICEHNDVNPAVASREHLGREERQLLDTLLAKQFGQVV